MAKHKSTNQTRLNKLFHHLEKEHGILLLESELLEIVRIVEENQPNQKAKETKTIHLFQEVQLNTVINGKTTNSITYYQRVK